ncbi:hypothetical protein [Aquipuribacter nitratireducens]|uniref:Glycosyltransferase RgtA/B/C/D-like domain-containing protein n=1 Tax=Aquipuribacter nitratireducens TaxID=650104 RepID=A0ABW0GGZ3_9MICO
MDTSIDAAGPTPVTTAATPVRATAPARAPRTTRPGARPWQWVLVLAAVAAVQTALSLDATAPVQTKDEIGYLMAARLLGGGGGADLIMPPHAGGYSAGWGLLVSPLWSVADSPVTFLHLSVAVNVVLATVAVVVWAAVSRRLGAGPRAALLVGGVVAVAPGRALYTGYALPEALIGLLVALSFLLVLRLWDDGTTATRPQGPVGLVRRVGLPVASRTGTAAALALTAGYLGLVHSRFVPTAALLVVVVAWWAWRTRPRGGWVVVALGAAGVAGSVVANRLVEARLYGEVDRFSAAGDQIGQLHIGFMTSLTVGHAWYGAVAWGGMTVVAVLWLLRLARREWEQRSPGPYGVLLAIGLGQLLVGAFYLSTRLTVGAGRLDQVVYGRYMDPVWSLLAVVGLTVVVTGRLDRLMWRRAVWAVGLLGLGVAVVLFAVGGIVGGLVQLNPPGIEMWDWVPDGELRVPWVQATLAALVVLVAIRWLQARAVPPATLAGVVLVALGAAAVTGSFVAEHRTIDARDDGLRQLFTLRDTVEEYPDADIALIVDRPLLLTGTAFQYWLGDRDYRLVDPAQEAIRAEPGELLIGALVPRPLIIGAPHRLVEIDPTLRYGVWYAPTGSEIPATDR